MYIEYRVLQWNFTLFNSGQYMYIIADQMYLHLDLSARTNWLESDKSRNQGTFLFLARSTNERNGRRSPCFD